MEPEKIAAMKVLYERGALPPEKMAAYKVLMERGDFTENGFILKPEYVEQPDRQQTGEISTITGKPIAEKIGNAAYSPAKFGTLLKAGFVDDNDAKIKLFADARGITPDRYEIKDGKIWFRDDDGNMYPETPREFDSILKKLVAELPSEGMADLGAGIGAIGGPVSAVAGAGVGEFFRKQIGQHLFGDSQTAGDYATDMGLQMLFAGLDSGVAKALTNKLNANKIKRATGGKITGKLVDDVGNISNAQRIMGREIKQKADNIGVDVLPHQAMDDPTLTGYYSMLRDNPKTARQVRAADDRLEQQAHRAGQRLVLEISPNDTDPFEIGSRLSDAGTEIIDKMKQARGLQAGPSYEAAYSSGVQVDTMPVLEEITQLKQSVKPGMKAHGALSRIEKMLQKKTTDADGNIIIVPETDIEIIDNVKQEIDGFLTGKNASSITNKLKRKMKLVKDQLTTQTDAVSPDYQRARKIFELASPEITETESGVIGALAGMKAETVKESAVNKIFSSPRSVRVAKRRIEAYDPELWKDTVAEYMRAGFEGAAKVAQGSGGKVLNRPGKYVSKMWDASDKKKLMLATEGMTDATGGPLYDRISDFFDVMEKASIGQGKESATQPRQKMEKELQGVAGRVHGGLSDIKNTAVNMFLQGAKDQAFDKNAKRLLDLMQTQEGVELIAKAKGFGPRTEQGLNAISTLLMMATQTNAGKVYDAVTVPEKQAQAGLTQGQ